MKVCDALADVVNTTIGADSERFACTLAGAIAGTKTDASGKMTIDKAACKEAMDQCLMMSSSATTTTMETCNIDQAKSELMDCNATVGELQSCIDATVGAFHDLIGSLSCDDVSLTTMTASPNVQTPAACQTLQTKCPNLNLSGDSSSGSGSHLPPSPTGCDDTCPDSKDDFCDDGGPGSDTNFCGLGTDCTDCGMR